MRKLISLLCATALMTPMPSTMAQQSDESRIAAPTPPIPPIPPTPADDLCRQPEALPNLGEEKDMNRQNGASDASHIRRGGAPATLAAAAAPAPRSPSEAMPEGDGETIIVAGTKHTEVVMESPAEVSGLSSDSVGAYSAKASSSDRAIPGYTSPPIIAPPSPSPPARGRQPQPQSGLLTAGEHDDLLNPQLYANYVSKSSVGQVARDVPVLDTERVLTVETRDARGQAMPFVEVEIRCANGKSITLDTVADGRAVFFPSLDRLGDSVYVRAGDNAWRFVDLAGASGGQKIGFTLDEHAQKVRKLDLALVVDVTGSMSDELRFLQAELDAIVDALNARHSDLDIRVGFTFYRDQGDQFVTRTIGFDDDMAKAKSQLANQSANGGGDYPEAMHTALIRANNLKWRDGAVKSLLLVADAPPHNSEIGMTWRAAEHLRDKRVHIIPVGASGVADEAEYVMRAMAAATQSRYTFLTDDSGIGNPHAKPAIDCYLVTRLDSLLRRVIDSQISGRRIEPDNKEVIRKVGNYDAGRCILPQNFGQ